jgi:hypothetical protein
MSLSFITPNAVQAASPLSGRSSNGNFCFALKAPCDFSESREMP